MIGEKKILAVVTARAGSVGVAGKNYKLLLGKPLVIWSVEAAFKSKYIDNIFVSTNCEQVKRAVNEWLDVKKDAPYLKKVAIVDRPEELSGPKSKNEEALLHSVQVYEEKFNNSPDIIVNLQPTSPVRNNHLLDLCIESMHDAGSDSLLTVCRHTPFMWRIQNDEPHALYDVVKRPMRQQLKDPDDYYFHDNGNIYAMTLQTLTDSLCRIGKNPFLYETTPYQSLQIDTIFDFQLIEKMAEIYGSII